MVALAVALGVGRFAFTPLLPLMLQNGSIDIRHGGWLASFNYAGYFIGAITCAVLRVDHARVVRAGLAITVVLTVVMGVTDAFWVWALVRLVGGAISAWTFVFASQWCLRRLAELDAHRAMHQVICTRLFAGRTVIHILADDRPDPGFEPADGGLEDVYFSTLSAMRRDAA